VLARGQCIEVQRAPAVQEGECAVEAPSHQDFLPGFWQRVVVARDLVVVVAMPDRPVVGEGPLFFETENIAQATLAGMGR